MEAQWDIGRNQNGLMFFGALSADSVAAVAAALRQDDTLIINSPGGDRSAGYVLGQDIRRKGVTVDVNGSCFSACALYLALPAPETKVGRGATLLFHNTTRLWVKLLDANPTLFSPEEANRIRRADSELIELVREAGIDPALLECIDRATVPSLSLATNVSPPSADNQVADGDLMIPTAFDFVWLSPDVLEHFGAKNVDVNWILSSEARREYAEARGFRINWIDDPAECA